MGVGLISTAVGAVVLPVAYTGTEALVPPATAAAQEPWKRTKFDCPSPGLACGNEWICQVGFDDKPLPQLDYHTYVGTNGQSRLHLNIRTEGVHITLDPRSFRD